MAAAAKKNVVIVGAGYAGIEAFRLVILPIKHQFTQENMLY